MKRAALSLLLLGLVACSPPQAGGPDSTQQGGAAPPVASEPSPETAVVLGRALKVFQIEPAEVQVAGNPLTEPRVNLGRVLFYDPRLSASGTISCNSCHDLKNYGVDSQPTSLGHKGERGSRNSPTVYNAALHKAQFWDGRAPTVEEQAKGPVLNPVEMGLASAKDVEARLRAVPEYREMFAAAFPGEKEPVTFQNMALAIGAFERKLMTPSPFDRFLHGDGEAMTPDQVQGLQTFLDAGCATCHNGVAVGGGLFRKLGQVKPYETKDVGRYGVTKNEADRYVFKVPSLRNIDKTSPYLHDGSVTELDPTIRLMAIHQLGKTLTDEQVLGIVDFLGALTGQVPESYIAKPAIPAGPKTEDKAAPSPG